MSTREGSHKGLVAEVDLEADTTESESSSTGMRYRASGGSLGTESIRLDSPDAEGFVDVGVRHAVTVLA